MPISAMDNTPLASVERGVLLARFDALLSPANFRDYGPNGLQVEGRTQIARLVSGVTASRALIEAAVADKADAILVHHGLFWRGQDGRVTGWMKQRLALLLAHEINLFAYHLPLDAHPQLGNNAQLAALLGLLPLAGNEARFGEQQLGWLGTVGADAALTLSALARRVEQRLGRSVTCVGDPDWLVQRVGLCTGGAQGYFEPAIAAGAQAFITGEISEPQAHLARETGVGYLACGHHASERLGAAALGAAVAAEFGLVHRFIDIPNPA